MRAYDWSDSVNNAEASFRAGGRRHYNAVRQTLALVRQVQVAEMMLAGGSRWGLQSEIARRLGVDRATISRDVRKARDAWLRTCQPSLERRRAFLPATGI